MSTLIRRIETQADLSGAGFRYLRSWVPEEATRSMVLIHGYGEHSGRYDEMAMYFAARGFAVHALDQAGHGRSRGPRGDVDRFDRLMEEVVALVERARRALPEAPVVLVGHSMGGLVAAATAIFHSPEIDRLVLSGSLLEVSADHTRWKQLPARWLAPLGSRVGLSVGIDPRGLSRDAEVARRYGVDPFVKDRMSARFAAGMLETMRRVRSQASELSRPVLLLHGEDDPISPNSGSQAFFASLSGDRIADSDLKLYPDLLHEIFQEPEREQVWEDMLAWLNADSSR